MLNVLFAVCSVLLYVSSLYLLANYQCNSSLFTQQNTNNSKKTETMINKKEEQGQKLAVSIQGMQSAMQKAAVEAAKAVAQQAAA